jgi:hypothetical protein
MREYAIIDVHSGSRLSKVIGAAGPVGFGDGEGVGLTTGFTATPLFQINFFPLLMQVYLMLATVLVALTLLHFVPEIVAEKAEVVESSSAAKSEPIRATRLEPAFT